MFLNIHQSGVLTALLVAVVTWQVPRETAAISAYVLCTPYTIHRTHQFPVSLYSGALALTKQASGNSYGTQLVVFYCLLIRGI